MIKIITASKDASLYQAYPNINTGFDEILEIGKVVDSDITPAPAFSSSIYSGSSVRSVIYFNLPTTESVSANANYFLNLKVANASNIIRNQEIVVYRVSSSWVEGSGYFYQGDDNIQDGVSWVKYNANASWSLAGGNFLTSSTSASTTLSDYPLPDLRIDVTNILRPIVSQSLQSTFYGLAVQFPHADELSLVNQGNLKVFSTQTHTIHQPTLEIAWDNQTFNTGSLYPIPSMNVKITPTNLKETYTKGEVSKVTLTVRDEYPLKSFDSTLRYKNKYYLPTSSYYSIVDTQANVTVVPFNDYSKINADTTGSYMVLDTSLLYEGRFYTLKFKVQSGDYTRIINSDVFFKVN